jgi:seryl-tRNA synthetase
MHDIKYIRNNPEAFDAGLKRRGLTPLSAEILKLDEEKRAILTRLQSLQSQKNELASSIGAVNKSPTPQQLEIINKSQAFGRDIKKLQEQLPTIEENLNSILETIPNLPSSDVPDGTDEHGNKQVRVVGEKPKMDFKPKLHDELGVALKLMDFDGAAKLSGARFVVLKGALAKMERALASFMLDIHTNEFGYTEHVPPFLVKENAAYGTGNLPKFAEDLFKTENGFYLIPTAEMPLTNLLADTIIDTDTLPIRMTAYTPCFRSEAGAAGKDTRGMIRQHQFSKVELVSITSPDKSEEEHERMTACAEEILKRLGLHYRVMLLCTGDMGFCAQKTYDLEVWMPGQNAFREISSCSNCGAFQARRMKARSKAKGAKETEFVHTLNGSGLAIGRTMVAILENYQQADGSIAVPEALQPYMGGIKIIKMTDNR